MRLFSTAVVAVLVGAGQAAAADAPTFYKDVLPVLQANCQTCHRPGEVAPMSLLTYEQARPWAKAIKTAVASKKMPPWFADPAYGHFSNERRLSAPQIELLGAWADAGAPAGDEKDAPPPVEFTSGWNIKPDVVFEMPKPFELPARGTINYKYVVVDTNTKEDMWVVAAEMRPGNPAVLHHGKVWVRPPGSKWMEKAIPGEAYESESHKRHPRPQRDRGRQRHPGQVQPGPGRAAVRHGRRGQVRAQGFGPGVRAALHHLGPALRGRLEAGSRAGEGTAADALLLQRRPDRVQPGDPARRRQRRSGERDHVRRERAAGLRAAAHAPAGQGLRAARRDARQADAAPC